MTVSTNIHAGENIKFRAYSLSSQYGAVAVLEFVVETRPSGGSDRVEITTFMKDYASLEKLKRAAEAFNEAMAKEPALAGI